MQINNIANILQCPECSCKLDQANDKEFVCSNFHSFHINQSILDLSPSNKTIPDIYNVPDFIRWTKISSELLLDSYSKTSKIDKIQDYGHRWLESHSSKTDGFRLDIGCGFGRHFEFAANKENLIGFDANQESLKTAKKNYPDSVFIKGYIDELPFSDDSFDEVIAVYSLEHVLNLDKALSEIKRVLKNDASLIVGLPAEGGFVYDTLRKVTTIPYFSKKYDLDYEKVVHIEHCNTASKVMDLLKEKFSLMKSKYYPIPIKSVNINLIVLAIFINDLN